MVLLRALLLLMSSVAFFMSGHGLLGTVISVRLNDALPFPLALGLIQASYFAGLTIGAFHAAAVVRAVGHIRSYAAFAALYAGFALTLSIVPEGPLWAGLRLAQGFCVAGILMCVESWLGQIGKGERLGFVLASYTTVTYLGFGVGQLLLMVAPAQSDRIMIMATMATVFAVAPVALTRTREPQLPDVHVLSLKAMLAASPLGVATTFVSGTLVGAFFVLGPVLAEDIGMNGAQVGIFMAVLILGGLVLQFPLGRFSDLIDRRIMLLFLFGMLTLIGTAACMISVEGDFIRIAVLMTLIGGLTFTLYPLGLAHILDFVSNENSVSAAGAAVLAYSLGATAGPIVGSALVQTLGPGGLFVHFALLGAIMVPFCGWRQIAGGPMPSELGNDYLAVPRTTPVAAVLDPRTEDEQLSFDFTAHDETEAETSDTFAPRERSALTKS